MLCKMSPKYTLCTPTAFSQKWILEFWTSAAFLYASYPRYYISFQAVRVQLFHRHSTIRKQWLHQKQYNPSLQTSSQPLVASYSEREEKKLIFTHFSRSKPTALPPNMQWGGIWYFCSRLAQSVLNKAPCHWSNPGTAIGRNRTYCIKFSPGPLTFYDRHPQRKEGALSVALYKRAEKGQNVFVAILPVKPFNISLSFC